MTHPLGVLCAYWQDVLDDVVGSLSRRYPHVNSFFYFSSDFADISKFYAGILRNDFFNIFSYKLIALV